MCTMYEKHQCLVKETLTWYSTAYLFLLASAVLIPHFHQHLMYVCIRSASQLLVHFCQYVMSGISPVQMSNLKTSSQSTETVDKNSNPAVLSVCVSFFIQLSVLTKKLMFDCSSCLQTDTQRGRGTVSSFFSPNFLLNHGSILSLSALAPLLLLLKHSNKKDLPLKLY